MDSTKTLLGRAFRVLCLEWEAAAPDGAAGAAAELRARIERLTSLGVDVALVAEAGIDHVDPRLRARPDVEGRLFLLLSDGAEAYVLGPAGPRLIERRLVSPGEEEQLTRAVQSVRDDLAARGLATSARGGDRWRRAIALPRPRAGDGYESGLAAAGIAGPEGLVELATRLAHGAGVPRPCVTWRGGRLEFSLTDFADSMRWLLQWVVRYRDYDAREVLVVGEDFGPGGAGGGAARRLMIPELHGASFASVGAGPDGAGRRVRRLGGGHAAVLELLDEQIELRRARVLESFPAPNTDPSLAVPGRGLRPLPRARGRDLADRRQRGNGHPRLARRGVAGLDAGHVRGRRLRRRHRRAAHPRARHGARLALSAAARRRHAVEPDERRGHRAPPAARHEPGDRLSLLAPARPRWAVPCACARRALPRFPTAP